MLLRKHIIFLLFFGSSFINLFSQTDYPFKIGLSTNANIPIGEYWFSKEHIYAFPGLPLPLTINIKYKRHELIGGPDFYRFYVEEKSRIIGLDFSYRYHFYKPNKKPNFYLDISAYYVEFAYGTALPVSYYFSSLVPNNDCISIYKVQTPAASTCIGIELPFLKYITFFSSVGVGFIYVKTDIDPSCKDFILPVRDKFMPTANVVIGLACYFYSKSATEKKLETTNK